MISEACDAPCETIRFAGEMNVSFWPLS